MKKDISAEEAYSKISALCASSEHCADDIHKKLLQMCLTEEEAVPLIEKLTEQNFLNEQRYAEAFARDRFHYSGWGKNKIAFALRNKKISTAAIHKAVNQIDETEYRDYLIRLLHSKNKVITARNNYERKGKLMRFAIGRGFETEIVTDIIDTLGNTSAKGDE